MSEETIDKILDRYGVLGGVTIMLALIILIFAWVLLCMAYPVFIVSPVLLAGWMIWKVRNDD